MWLYLTICFSYFCMVTLLVRWTAMTFFSPITDHYNCTTSCLCPCWSWAGFFHDIVFDPLSILSDFKDKSQYYFANLNVSSRYWIIEQFCHKLDFFDLQIAKKLQLIDSAACRLRFKLAEMNSIDTFYTQNIVDTIIVGECSVYC